MAILIPNMEMPKNCMDCDLQYDMCACILTGTRFWTKDTFDPAVERLPDCPILEVPNINNHMVGETVAYGDMVTLAKIMPKQSHYATKERV